jgi:RHS repeat-associated protein
MATAGTFSDVVGYRGERLDTVLGQYYSRARLYDPRSGRFMAMDPFGGNTSNPLSLHKYHYAHLNPINALDPSGLFTVTSLLSVTGIQRTIGSGLRTVSTGLKVYNTVKRLLTLLEYAQIVLRFLSALGAPTLAAAAVALEAEIKSRLGAPDIGDILHGFDLAANVLNPHWKNIARAIKKKAPNIANELAARVATRIPGYVALQVQGRLKAVLFVTSGPGGKSNDKYIDVTSDIQVALSSRGGRLFGLGFRTSKKNVDQLFRIDYWDVRLPPARPTPTPLHVHYHLIDDKPIIGTNHPSGRTIWP